MSATISLHQMPAMKAFAISHLRFMTVLLTGVAVAFVQPAASGAQPPRRPNVVVLMTDDQGYGDLGCHGNPILQTPHLDRLHGVSVRLTDFHVDPTCSPTRAALMTGRYSTRTGVWHTVMGRHMPRRDEVMMPRVFADSGYRTGIFGKWHLGDNFPFRPQDRGFEVALIHGGGGVGQIPDFWGNDYFDDTYLRNGQPEKFQGYCTDVWFGEATGFIEQCVDRNEPFFCYIATNAPHSPFRVAERYREPYTDKVDGDEDLATFCGMIANIDENVGRLLGRLDTLGVADETIFIFMTDNGTSRGVTFTETRGNEGVKVSGYNAGRRGKKGSPYEGGHRVPCFIRWPGGELTGGRDIDQLTSHIDLLPTLIELCSLAPPVGVRFDGRSLAPLLQGQAGTWAPRTLFAHHQELPDPERYRYGCVMRGSWRLVLRNDVEPAPRFELFSLESDPGQTGPLGEGQAAVAGSLRGAYESWWRELAADFDRDARIVIGDERQPVARLTCFEWHGSRRWSQTNIKRGIFDNGLWALTVARPGRYRVQLRRWPQEAGPGAAIAAALEGGKTIAAIKARLLIGEVDVSRAIEPGAASVDFEVRLEAGDVSMQSWLIGRGVEGGSVGAYYATVRRIGQ